MIRIDFSPRVKPSAIPPAVKSITYSSPIKIRIVNKLDNTTKNRYANPRSLQIIFSLSHRLPKKDTPVTNPIQENQALSEKQSPQTEETAQKVIVATIALGKICRYIIRQLLTPKACAALTYSKLRVLINSARTTPTKLVHEKNNKIASKSPKRRHKNTSHNNQKEIIAATNPQISSSRCVNKSTLPPQ